MEHKLTTKPVTVSYPDEASGKPASEITIPACTMAILIEHDSRLRWVVKNPKLLIRLTNNTHDPFHHYCWLPEEAFQ